MTLSIDGSTGEVFLGEVPVVPRQWSSTSRAASSAGGRHELVKAVDRIMTHADKSRRLRVRANADTPADATRARKMGAEGIGLCAPSTCSSASGSTYVERLILAENDEDRKTALDALLPLQRKDFIRILEAMDGLPVTIRLLDPPLHEFLPDLTELAVRVALPRSRASRSSPTCACCRGQAAARAEPDAGPARRAPRPGPSRPVRPAGARDRRGGLLPAAHGRAIRARRS